MSVVYQHFRPEEKVFIDQVIGWKEYVLDSYADKLTDFLDPREQFILQAIIGEKDDVRYKFFGGYDDSERKRAIIYPEYLTLEQDNFEVSLFEIDYPTKFIKLNHRTVLGSMMSLGLTREKFGDILIQGERIQFFVSAEVEEFVKQQLVQMGKAKVSINKQDLANFILPDERWRELQTTASSLRLDVIISAGFNVSRQKAQMLIQQGNANVNWETIERPAFECGESDIISVRGHGRCKVIEILGRTKKDKMRIKLGLLK
ncbi:YlmH family RNA-binding protein [Pseudogracilibacillus auburnensis]|uniref:YlmH family RNA-binding protein n=1 Tax=Pseudogracilibacillus auburnensis TaxID=1494959 RepID=UPI001A97BC54|nr:RNA-binding protein [Pseudogracilibacillus auburnensis]MBO1004951.1 RNA-binding protein [Pseudogracilibacillus auburnensis]